MDVQKKKQRLRETFLEARNNLSQQEYRKKSDAILKKLLSQPEYIKASTVHCYVAMKQRREVDTHPLMQALLESPKKIATSVTDFKTGRLKSFYIEKLSDLKENKWGVLEPAGGEPAKAEELDLVIVPMVGGDKHRNRIGYGKGFYDRFLSEVNGTTIGLLYECCLVDSIPVESFDIPLDKVITEQQVIT